MTKNDLLSDPTISVPEAGRLLGVGRNCAYEAARRGEIPTIRIGRMLRVPKAALRRMLSLDGGPGSEDQGSTERRLEGG